MNRFFDRFVQPPSCGSFPVPQARGQGIGTCPVVRGRDGIHEDGVEAGAEGLWSPAGGNGLDAAGGGRDLR
jgi:hypothetical protein